MKENNRSIFEVFNENDNFKFSELFICEYSDIFALLKTFLLEYRPYIDVSKKNTFGCEIESSIFGDKNEVYKDINQFCLNHIGWNYGDDDSIDNGIELKSPIMYDTFSDWEELKLACQLLDNKTLISNTCGGHIHIGAHILENNPKYYYNFLYLWTAYERIIMHFLYGEYYSFRPSLSYYAPPIARYLWDELKNYRNFEEFKRPSDYLNFVKIDRYNSVNFLNVKYENYKNYYNTIEFRCPNGTLDPIIWQNNINLLIKCLNYAKSPNFDRDFVLFSIKNNYRKLSSLNQYNYIFADEAFQFADLIFDNNLDKIYFLRQYYKDGKERKTYSKCEPFTLKLTKN